MFGLDVEQVRAVLAFQQTLRTFNAAAQGSSERKTERRRTPRGAACCATNSCLDHV